MVILPKNYNRRRLRTILAYKYISNHYEFDPGTDIDFYVPIDARYAKIINFKVNTDTNEDISFLSLGINPSNLNEITTDTILWYQDIEGGNIFDTALEAYTVNYEYKRPPAYKEYFHSSDFEGIFLHYKGSSISKLDLFIVYEDLDDVK